MGAVLIVAVNTGADGLTRQAEGDEDDPAIDAGDAGAKVGQGIDFHFDFLMVFEGGGDEFFRWPRHRWGETRPWVRPSASQGAEKSRVSGSAGAWRLIGRWMGDDWGAFCFSGDHTGICGLELGAVRKFFQHAARETELISLVTYRQDGGGGYFRSRSFFQRFFDDDDGLRDGLRDGTGGDEQHRGKADDFQEISHG